MLFQGCWLLANQSDYLISDYLSEFYIFAVIVAVFSGSIIFYGIWKYRQNKLAFRSDQRTKLMTCAEIGTSATAFSLFAIAAYFKSIFNPSDPALLQGDVNKRQVIHQYQWFSFELMLLAYLVLFIAFALFHVFLPKQVVDNQPAE